MRISSHRRFLRRFTSLTACGLVLAGGVGCTFFRNAGTGEHLDAPRERLSSEKNVKKRDMLVEVTTDASGEVVNVQFKRSSGSDVVDAHVADTIHSSWPRVPSTVTEAELTFSVADGFSQPRTISSHPAP